MRTRVFLFFIATLFLVSCQKNTADLEHIPLPQDYYIKCKIDGIDKSFNIMAKANRIENSNQVFLSIFGKASPDLNNTERINMGISGMSAIKTGHYVENDTSFTYFIDAIYNPANTFETWTIGTDPKTTSPFTIFISGIDEKSVSGTFKGAVYNKSTRGLRVKYITNGEFYVPFNTPPQ